MSSIGLANPLPPASTSRPVIWRICTATAVLLSLVGCVSQSTYDTATSEADNIRTELNRVRMEIQTLEEQKEGLHKLALKGETVLAGIRTELQRARESYAQHKSKLNKLSALQDKARTLSQQRTTYTQDIKTAKKNAVKLQDRHQSLREGGRPDSGGVESLKVSQSSEISSDTSKIVATVSPLSSIPSPAPHNPAPSLPNLTRHRHLSSQSVPARCRPNRLTSRRFQPSLNHPSPFQLQPHRLRRHLVRSNPWTSRGSQV